jgi:hypothetical protein
MPVLHGDDVQVGADVVFAVEELRQLADREAVTHRQWKISDKTCFVGIEHRPFHNLTAERIGAVEDEKRDVSLGSCLHAICHCCRVRIEPHAGVLNVEDQRVNALQHFVRGTKRFSIEAVNAKARRGIFGGSDLFIIAAGKAVLRAEQGNQLNSRGMG